MSFPRCSIVPPYLLRRLGAAEPGLRPAVEFALQDGAQVRHRREVTATRWPHGHPPARHHRLADTGTGRADGACRGAPRRGGAGHRVTAACRAGQVWYDTMTTRGLVPRDVDVDVDFARFAAATVVAARRRHGDGPEGTEVVGALLEAWNGVGVPVR